MSHATLGWRDGWLCAVETTVRFSEPVQDTTYWPILREAKHLWEHDLGKPLCKEGVFTYSMKIGGFWKELHLSEGGKTKALHVESQLVPRPARLRSELRWHNGRWEKYSRKQGWIIA